MSRAPKIRIPSRREPGEAQPGVTLPGHDAGRDSARHYAAVGFFGVVALSMVSLAVAAYAFRPVDAADPIPAPFAQGLPAIGVAADMPMLRPSLGAEGDDASITVFDGATGRREVMAGREPLDTADAAHVAGQAIPATLTP